MFGEIYDGLASVVDGYSGRKSEVLRDIDGFRELRGGSGVTPQRFRELNTQLYPHRWEVPQRGMVESAGALVFDATHPISLLDRYILKELYEQDVLAGAMMLKLPMNELGGRLKS